MLRHRSISRSTPRLVAAILGVWATGCVYRLGFDPPPRAPELTCAERGELTSHDAAGAGTADDPFLLCTVAQLLDLMDPASAGSWSATFRLGADLDLAGFDDTTSPAVRPIGNSATPFTGVFDGAGHTLRHLTFTDATASQVALFGAVRGTRATIRALALEEVDVTGYQGVAPLAAYLGSGAVVMSCSATGQVSVGLENVGGLVAVVGELWTDPAPDEPAVITTSWSSARVSTGGYNNAGGLVALLGNNSFCVNSYATGEVAGGLNYVGGLVAGNTGVILNSYATGAVFGVDAVGGLVGSSGGLISGSFATGDVTVDGGSDNGLLVGEQWRVVQDSYSLTTAVCTPLSGSCHPAVAGETAVTTVSRFFAPTAPPLSSWDFAGTWVAGAAFPVLAPRHFDPSGWGGCAATAGLTPFAGGRGSLEAPFLICSAAQLAAAGLDTAGWPRWRAYRLAADLELGGTPLGGLPLGRWGAPFRGFFDGDGHTIAGLSIDGGGDHHAGLFGLLSGFVVRLRLEGVGIVNGSSQLGGLVGELERGFVMDCAVEGDIAGPGGDIGGIVGRNLGSVSNSYFVGSIDAGYAAGGVLGGHLGCVANAFAVADVQVDPAEPGGPVIGADFGETTAEVYCDATRACLNCDNALGTCLAAPGYFFDPGNAPLSAWDFECVWEAPGGGYPALRNDPN